MSDTQYSRSGRIVDIINRKVFPGTIEINEGKIVSITEDASKIKGPFILPGFIDSHIHIESSMLIPSEFARLASVHGTVGTVSDPHEIANILGVEGIRYMIRNGRKVPFHFAFGASSCVPATSFETAGATIDSTEIEKLFKEDNLAYLSEMMNYPGVLAKDPEVIKKIAIAKAHGKPIDGHAPGLTGQQAIDYINAGISTDHECFTLEEALFKLENGMKILIREGSAAKNYEELHPLIKTHPDKVMFCSDDKHPHELVEGHINQLVVRSIHKHGYDLMDVLRIASLNPIEHYKLEAGLLRVNDSADFILVENLENFPILETHIKGQLVAEKGRTLISSVKEETPNHFSTCLKEPKQLQVEAKSKHVRVIVAEEGQLITKSMIETATVVNNSYVSDTNKDLLKLVVVNRYNDAPPAVAFIKNFGFKRGAIASCIAHDSHNIIAVGCQDGEICRAINLLITHKGGICVNDDCVHSFLPLPVAGIMSNEDGYLVARRYAEIDKEAKNLGSSLYAPFMTLSFMALLVIPQLKLSDKGLFDGSQFKFVPLEP